MILGKKEKIQIAVTAGLAVVLVVVFRHNFVVPVSRVEPIAGNMLPAPAPVSPAQPSPSPSEKENGDTSVLKKLKEEAGNLALGRDPFNQQAGVTAAKGPVLSGIAWDTREPAAIINGQVVRVGDTLESPPWHKVLAIEKTRVILNDGERDIELMLESK